MTESTHDADSVIATADEPGTPRSSGAHTLTFLFTDVEGSTRLWEQAPAAMAPALERHDSIIRAAIAQVDGTIVKTMGDGLMAVFTSAVAAIDAGLAAQRGLSREAWPAGASIRVRMGVHTGRAEHRASDYFGPTVNRTARIMAAGHGGQILLSESSAALVVGTLATPLALRDLGEHRLRDLERPERLFQLVAPELIETFPPLRTLDYRPNNLPTQTSAFVGREIEVAAIQARIREDGIRLVTLTGPGGSGKTRLALRAAADLIDHFPDGVFFVDLAGATDTDGVVALIATTVGLRETAERSPVDELKRQLRLKRVLLVLDNMEQVTVAAATLADLLGECPGLTLLVTSREGLQVRGEHLLAVPPLSLPEAGAARQTASDVSQFEAIQLFVERARAVRPEFHLTDDNAAAVADICRRLDGLPLAIELATARLALFSPEALRDRLGSRLQLLRSGPRDLPVRQQTLRATIEWSYQLLEPAEQRLFEVLSIFSGTDFEAVEAVVGRLPASLHVADVVDGLGSLLNKSLLRETAAVSGNGLPRVVMLETIREYAGEQLAGHPELSAAAREAHADYFAGLAAALWEIASAGEPTRALDGLTLELENLRTAWRHWVGARDLGRLTQLVDGLWHLYEARGWYHATIELINDQLGVLATAPATPERWSQEVTLRTSLARVLTLLRGYTQEVEDAYEHALALFDGQREIPQFFPVLRSLVSFHGFRGEYDKGLALTDEILRLAEQQGDAGMRVDGLSLLGTYTGFKGDLEGALVHMDAAIELFEAKGYRPRRLRLGNDHRVSCLTTSGFFAWLVGRPDDAVRRADRAVALAAEMDHPYSLAYAHYHSGFLHLWRREPETVKARALGALEVVNEHDFPIWRALGTCLLGAAMTALGDVRGGLERIDEGLDAYKGLRTPPVFWPLVRFTQASAFAHAGDADGGLPLIDEAIAIAGPDEILAPLFHIVRGDLLALRGERDAVGARAAYQEAFDRSSRSGARSPLLRASIRLCGVASPGERTARLADLGDVYQAFSEGLTTPDLRDAADLLSAG